MRHVLYPKQYGCSNCDACKKKIEGHPFDMKHYYLCRCDHCNYNLCERCFDSGAASANKGVPYVVDPATPTCPDGHVMKKHIFAAGETTPHYCDLCRRRIFARLPDGDFYFTCMEDVCNWQICSYCYEHFKCGKATFKVEKCDRDHVMHKADLCAGEKISELCQRCRKYLSDMNVRFGGFYFRCTGGCNRNVVCFNCCPPIVTPPPEEGVPICPKGHNMEVRVLNPGESARCSCDKCRKSIAASSSSGVLFYQCRTSGCDNDLCAACFQKGSPYGK